MVAQSERPVFPAVSRIFRDEHANPRQSCPKAGNRPSDGCVFCSAAITLWGTILFDHDSAYYRARAEEEILAAECADHPDAARAHFLLAGYYLDLAHNPHNRPETPEAMDGFVQARFAPPSARDHETCRPEV